MELRFYEMSDDEFISFCESNDYHTSSITGNNFILLRGYGWKYNVETAKFLHKHGLKNTIIYTNDEGMLEELKCVCWNNRKKRKKFNIFINDVNIHDLTIRELRIGHNLTKLYQNGEFEKEEESERKEKRAD